MIFTIGKESTYEAELTDREARGERLMKVGRDGNTPGGSVWQTYEEAAKYLKARQTKGRLDGYRIYGVEADWAQDTESESLLGEATPWNTLLVDAPIVRVQKPVEELKQAPRVRRTRKKETATR